MRGKEQPWLQHRLFGTMEGSRPTGATWLCKLQPSCSRLPKLLRGWAQHQGLMAQEGTHCPAAVAGLGVTPRAWEGHSDTGRGGWGRASHGLLGTGEQGQHLLSPGAPPAQAPVPWDVGSLCVPWAVGPSPYPWQSRFCREPCFPHISHHCCKTFPLSPHTAAHSSRGALSHSPPSLGRGCSEQVNSHPGAPSLSCLRGRSAVVAPRLVLPTDPAGVSSFLQLSCPCQGSSPGKQICFSHLSHPSAPSCSPSCARPHPEHRWSTLGKILLKSRRCLWPRRQICVLVRVDSQVHTPACLFPRAGREWESQQRSEPAPWAGDRTELSVMLVLLLPPLLQLQHQRESQAASVAGELPPGLHRSGWGVPPEKGPFGMQLSLCTAACWAPRAPR